MILHRLHLLPGIADVGDQPLAAGEPGFDARLCPHLIDPAEPTLDAVSSAVFDEFAALVAAVPDTGRRRGTDPRLVAASLWAALHGLAQLWLWGGLDRASFAPSPESALAVTLDAYLGS